MTYTNKNIHVVMGISSSGKSTFINKSFESGEWEKSVPIVMAWELEKSGDKTLQHKCIVHYNMFRPYENDTKNIGRKFISDAVLGLLLRQRQKVGVTILLARRSALSKRILLRKNIEPVLHSDTSNYPSESIFELLCNIDLVGFHDKWFQLLDHFNIPYRLIESETGNYEEFKNATEALSWLKKTPPVQYANSEINEIVERFKFEYQAMKLPNGSITVGDDRAETVSIITKYFPDRSVLDIGSAYGYFCFEAEKNNALTVVGTELKRHRFIGSNIVKEFFGSQCKFFRRDVFEEPFSETFDVVLFLNVIHHLKEPIRALRMVANMAKEIFIIEFPDIRDGKFAKTFEQNKLNSYDDLPLIGVSLLGQEDQTFLFNEEAIRRILMEHDAMCSHIDFFQSPMSTNRKIAICYK